MKSTKNMLKKLVVIILCCLIGSFDLMFGLGKRAGDDLFEESRREVYAYNHLETLKFQRDYNVKRAKELSEKIKERADAGTADDDINLMADRQELSEIQRTLRPGHPLGRIVAKGIAGTELGDNSIDGVGDGILKGITARTAQAFGEVISERAKGTMEHVLGGAWDTTVESLVNGFNELDIRLFHNSKKPFTETLISGWFELILGSLKDIELILKDYLKESSRGHDKSLRQFDGDHQAEEANSGWRDLVTGDIEIFDHIAHEIEGRKEHYEEDDPIVYFANQIQKRLLKFRHLLAKAKTIKELDASFDSNRSIVEALKNDLARLFKHLTDLITPRSYPSSNRNASSQAARAQAQKTNSKYGGSKYGRSDREEEFPASFGG